MKIEELDNAVNIQHYWYMLKNKLHYIFILMFLGIGFAAIYTFFVATPKYESTVQMIAQTNNEENKTALNDLNANILLVNTYKDMIQSNKLLLETQNELKKKEINLSVDEIRRMISIQQSQNSQMFELKVVTNQPQKSQMIGETLAETFQKEVEAYSGIEKVKVVSPASISNAPVSPNNKTNLLIGLFVGIGLGVLVVFLGEIINNTIKSSEFITEEADIQILGTISDVSEKVLREGKEIDLVYYRENPRQFKKDFYPRKRVKKKHRKKE